MNTNTYRINREKLLDRLRIWDSFLGRKVHLIACGGTALTLLGIKDSTKDIDFVVPNEGEYDYLVKRLQEMGYKYVKGTGLSAGDVFVFDLFRGKKVHTTDLIESPLENENNIKLEEFERIYLGVLNYYDLIISKLFRGELADFEDCLMLIRAKKEEIDLQRLGAHFRETASYDISEEKVNKNLDKFLEIIKHERNDGK
jgi:hypothetical protein